MTIDTRFHPMGERLVRLCNDVMMGFQPDKALCDRVDQLSAGASSVPKKISTAAGLKISFRTTNVKSHSPRPPMVCPLSATGCTIIW